MTLPANISEATYGYRLRITRPGLVYHAYVKFAGDKPAALRHAIALRDQFIRIHGQYTRGNTGQRGISETTKWFHGRPYPCFEVTCPHGRRRFTFTNLPTRDTAFKNAVAWRETVNVCIQPS